jgi:hypothetical protein
MNEEIGKELKEIKSLFLNLSRRVGNIIDKVEKDVVNKLHDVDIEKDVIKGFKDQLEVIRKSAMGVYISGKDNFTTSPQLVKKSDGKIKTVVTNPSNEWVKATIMTVGSKIGSVHFKKREDGSLRKMCYRLHVKNPSVVAKPKSFSETSSRTLQLGSVLQKSVIDKANNQITVYDVNKVVRNKDGVIIGRGSYRTIPLEKVVRIVSNGCEYEIKRDNTWDIN